MEYPFVDIHTHSRTGDGIEIVSVMAGRKGVMPEPPFSIGIHPWQVGDDGGRDTDGRFHHAESRPGRGGLSAGACPERASGGKGFAALREIETAPASAIGEIGLDYAAPGDRGLQKTVFAACLRIAGERHLPVVLHCVRAFEPTMEMLAEHRLPAVIFHGFAGSRQQVSRAVRAGYYLSFGERSFASPKTVDAFRGIPLEKLFLETDESTLSIGEIYARAAAIRAIPLPQLIEQLYNNYKKLFLIPN